MIKFCQNVGLFDIDPFTAWRKLFPKLVVISFDYLARVCFCVIETTFSICAIKRGG